MDLIPSSSSSSSPQKAAQKQEGRNGGQMLDGAEGGLCAQASTLFSHQQEKFSRPELPGLVQEKSISSNELNCPFYFFKVVTL